MSQKTDIFEYRFRFKPFEYPDLIDYRTAIRTSRWHVEEFDFGEDIQDFHTTLNAKEKNCIKNTMLAISQVEAASVKKFWGDIGTIFPKPEIEMVGVTFAENEVVHSESYSKLLEELGFNDDFDKLIDNPVIAGRVNYLTKYLKNSGENKRQFDVLKTTLFALFVENTSLFGQFLIGKSFRKHKNLLKSIDNVILSTQNDELVHAQFGIELIQIVKQENPDWFNEAFYHKIELACKKAYKAEEAIIDWIFEKGDLDFITAYDVKEFLKRRFNSSMEEIGAKAVFEEDPESKKKTKWFDEEIEGYIRNDFFNTKSRNYNKIEVKTKDILTAIQRVNNELV